MKILAVCGFGVGSSMILKLTIQKALREFGVDAEVINTDISDSAGHNADAVFSSPDFIGDLEKRFKNKEIKLYPIKRYSDLEEVKEKVQDLIDSKK